ncbi:MAG TPA: DMT family transporter [Aliidongia sp.]|uniref:DMT family transporter n=1 Tax=Aliidongia sp. TaxID=1914230 RepID=UPI002DDDACA1|nr:DMT family transporter [Aliidongia sp.]HEV2676997.1 DMT family transporter [Aliidongia sp.]
MTDLAVPVRPHARRLAGWALVTTILLWASSYPAIRAGLRGFEPGPLAALRYGVAALAFLVPALAGRLPRPRGADLGRIVVAGGLGIALYNLALNSGEVTVSAGAAGFLINCSPIFTALLGRLFLDERLRIMGWVGSVVSLGGVALIAAGEGGATGVGSGAWLILLAAGCQSIQFVLQKPLIQRYGALATTGYVVFVGALFLLPYLPAAVRAIPAAAGIPLASAIYLGLFPAALAYAAWSVVLAHFPAGRASSFLYLVAPLATGLAVLWLGEWPSPLALCGGVTVILGVILVNTLGRPRRA